MRKKKKKGFLQPLNIKICNHAYNEGEGVGVALAFLWSVQRLKKVEYNTTKPLIFLILDKGKKKEKKKKQQKNKNGR